MRSRPVSRSLGILLTTILLAACHQDSFLAAPEAEAPALDITDATHNQGNTHFHFLPPLVAKPSCNGTPDGTAAPVGMICEWNGSQCVDLVAIFSESEGTGGEVVSYDEASGLYQVNWHTDQCLTGACTLDPSSSYRLRVLAGAIELGHADLDVAGTGQELKNSETNEVIGLVNGRTLPIKFRIEQGAISRVAVGGSAIVGSGGGYLSTPDGSVGLSIPAGALNGPASISINAANGLPTLGNHAMPVDLGPDGQTFNVPVTLTLGFDPHELPEGVPPEALRLMTWVVDHWDEVPGAVLNVFDNTISAPINHFSIYWVGIPSTTLTLTGVSTLLDGQTATFTARTGFRVTQLQQYCYRHRHFFHFHTHCYTQPVTVTYPVSGMRVNWSTHHSSIASFAVPGYSVSINGLAVSPLLTANSPGTTTVVGAVSGFTGGAQGTSQLTVAGATALFAGSWTGQYTYGPMSALLTQTGNVVTGQITDAASCVYDVVGTATATELSLPSWTLRPPGAAICVGATITLEGTLDSSGNTITGSGLTIIPGLGDFPWTFAWTRNNGLVAPVAYWRFEGSSLGADSFGNADLLAAGSPSPTQIALPTAGPGARFPRSLPDGPNDRAAAFGGGRMTTTSLRITQAFTIEGFVHFNSLSGTYGKVIAGFGDANDSPWNFQVRLDGWLATQPRELILGGVTSTTGLWIARSGFVLEPGKDYYVAAAFELTGDVTFWLQDLTAGAPLLTSTVPHNLITALPNDARFTVGDVYTGDYDFEADAVFDEVRLVDRRLSQAELLIGVPSVSEASFTHRRVGTRQFVMPMMRSAEPDCATTIRSPFGRMS